MERRRLKPVALLSSDIDGTLAGDAQATQRFRQIWDALDPARRPVLVYNSGRLADDILEFVEQTGLPPADYVIGGVGTMLVGPKGAPKLDHFHERLSHGWSLEAVEAILSSHQETVRQPQSYQHAFKSSWDLHGASPESIAGIERALEQAGLDVTIVYSSNRDLDILPRLADKGQALAWLCGEIPLGLDEVLVAGDTNNDRSMFDLPGVRGIVVGNALPELRELADTRPLVFNATEGFAGGVLQGLVHWSVLEGDKLF